MAIRRLPRAWVACCAVACAPCATAGEPTGPGYPTIEAYRLLDPIGSLATRRALEGLQYARDARLRAQCAWTLGRMAADVRQGRWVCWLGGAEALSKVGPAEPSIRTAQVWAIGQLGPRPGAVGAIESLGTWNASCELDCRRIDALVKVGASAERVVPMLTQSLNSRNNCFATRVKAALIGYGWEAAPHLARLVRHGDDLQRRRAAQVLGQIGSAGSGAAEDLSWALSDNDPEVRAAAARALGCVGPVGRSGRWLATTLGDSNIDVRRAAAEAIGQLGRRSRGAASELAQAMLASATDPRAGVREGAWRALEDLGSELNVAPPHVVDRLRSQVPVERLDAAIELKESGTESPEVAAALFDAVRNGDYVMREALVAALARPHRKGESLAPLLKRLTEAQPADPVTRSLARAALKRVEPRKAG